MLGYIEYGDSPKRPELSQRQLARGTFAVLALGVRARVWRQGDVNVFRRRLDEGDIHKAYSTAGIYLFGALCGCMVLCVQGAGLTDALFETFSAMSTVGLSTGITRELSTVNRAVVIVMMYCGRIGSLSMMMALAQRTPPRVKDPVEQITIG